MRTFMKDSQTETQHCFHLLECNTMRDNMELSALIQTAVMGKIWIKLIENHDCDHF